MSNRGYVVSPELLPALEKDLQVAGVPYKVVSEPTGFGQFPRPVLVTTGAKPKGWSRYSACRQCGGPKELSTDGRVQIGVLLCAKCKPTFDESLMTKDYLWSILEWHTPTAKLKLPMWVDTTHAPYVKDVRDLLSTGELRGVGDERKAQVGECLNQWRRQVTELLSR